MPPPAEGFASRLLLAPALRAQSDRRLVGLVRDGYEAAFEEIVRRYGRPLGRYAASIVGGRSEDVTQDAFSKALVALRRDDAEIELRPWLFRIVRNTALNDLRDSPPSAEELAEAIAGGRNPAEELESREELADLIERLRALPEPQRAAIVMRELEGLGHDEIANALGLSGGAARQAIYRARRALRDGAGLLLPLPLLKLLLAGASPSAAEAAAGAAGLGAAAGVGGTAGAGVAVKATAATVLVAGAVGAGVVLEQAPRTGQAGASPPPGQVDSRGPGPAGDAGGDLVAEREGPSGRGGGNEGRDDRGGHGDGPGEDRGGSSGPGPDGSGHDDREDSNSGPGSSRSGHDDGSGEDGSTSGSGSSETSGSGGSGSGESSSGSGDSGDSSSGSGSGDDLSG
jgi:RNA polymerase sigma factor (sigma-70 family)